MIAPAESLPRPPAWLIRVERVREGPRVPSLILESDSLCGRKRRPPGIDTEVENVAFEALNKANAEFHHDTKAVEVIHYLMGRPEICDLFQEVRTE